MINRVLILVALTVLTAACATSKDYFNRNQVAYLNAQSLPPLKIPPQVRYAGELKSLYPIPEATTDAVPGKINLEPPVFVEPQENAN